MLTNAAPTPSPTSVATDTIKNIVNIVAHENLGLGTEAFLEVLARRFLDRYPQVEKAEILAKETRWLRLDVAGQPHPHGFVLDGNGKPFAEVTMTRSGGVIRSGLLGYTFMKTTGSGWTNYVMDECTTLKETTDRIAATAMDATWTWAGKPADFERANALILTTMLDVFATTYSHSVQDSLYRMGEAALAAIPELQEIGLACPNKHYIPMNLEPFGIENRNEVFLPTDEPHGQIECTIGRD